ncbi:MAG: hypothetical protein ACT4OM_06460 [Actinomycetota bacterium]
MAARIKIWLGERLDEVHASHEDPITPREYNLVVSMIGLSILLTILGFIEFNGP